MNTEQRLQQLEEEVRALKLARRDFLSTRIEERDLRIEGTLGIRTIKMYSGSGVPAMSAPTGSVYFRTDGTASNTLYVREAGAWRRVTTA
jgi:hypothetical protein